MTPGNNGASTPEDDDPFGYLYADGQANGAQPPSGGGYGYPGSVNRVRPVGERQYGGQQAAAPTAQYQQPVRPDRPAAAALRRPAERALPGPGDLPRRPARRPAAPVVQQRRRRPGPRPQHQGPADRRDRGGRRGGHRHQRGDDERQRRRQERRPGGVDAVGFVRAPRRVRRPAAAPRARRRLPKIDAKALLLGGGATTASDVEGADADGGIYVTGFNAVGASVTWNMNGIAKTATTRCTSLRRTRQGRHRHAHDQRHGPVPQPSTWELREGRPRATTRRAGRDLGVRPAEQGHQHHQDLLRAGQPVRRQLRPAVGDLVKA
jgi:hypothetical protein